MVATGRARAVSDGRPRDRDLIVGAGPTGLTLAAQLNAFGVNLRVIDRTPERWHESRALASRHGRSRSCRGSGSARPWLLAETRARASRCISRRAVLRRSRSADSSRATRAVAESAAGARHAARGYVQP